MVDAINAEIRVAASSAARTAAYGKAQDQIAADGGYPDRRRGHRHRCQQGHIRRVVLARWLHPLLDPSHPAGASDAIDSEGCLGKRLPWRRAALVTPAGGPQSNERQDAAPTTPMDTIATTFGMPASRRRRSGAYPTSSPRPTATPADWPPGGRPPSSSSPRHGPEPPGSVSTYSTSTHGRQPRTGRPRLRALRADARGRTAAGWHRFARRLLRLPPARVGARAHRVRRHRTDHVDQAPLRAGRGPASARRPTRPDRRAHRRDHPGRRPPRTAAHRTIPRSTSTSAY